MTNGLNDLCTLCAQSCKQVKGVLIIACPSFKDPRKDSGKFLNMAMNTHPGTIPTLAEGEEPR